MALFKQNEKKPTIGDLKNRVQDFRARLEELPAEIQKLQEELVRSQAQGEDTEEIFNGIGQKKAEQAALPKSIEMLEKEIREQQAAELEAEAEKQIKLLDKDTEKASKAYQDLLEAAGKYNEVVQGFENLFDDGYSKGTNRLQVSLDEELITRYHKAAATRLRTTARDKAYSARQKRVPHDTGNIVSKDPDKERERMIHYLQEKAKRDNDPQAANEAAKMQHSPRYWPEGYELPEGFRITYSGNPTEQPAEPQGADKKPSYYQPRK